MDRFTSRIYTEGLGFTAYQFYIDKFSGCVWIKTLDSSLELKILDRDETGYSVTPQALKSFPVEIIKKSEKWVRKSTLDLFLPFDIYRKLQEFIEKVDPHKYRIKKDGKLERVKQVKNRPVIDLRGRIHHPSPKKSEKTQHKPNYSLVVETKPKSLKGTLPKSSDPIVSARSPKFSGQ